MRWLGILVLLLVPAAIAHAQADEQATDGDAGRGGEIYAANCAMCHGADATGMMGMHPALTGVVERLSVEGVEITIRNGRSTRPPMPAFDARLDDADVADVIAFLGDLPDGPRNFAHETDEGMGDGGMMDRMMGGGNAALWLVVVMLAAALAGVVGYLIAARRPSR